MECLKSRALSTNALAWLSLLILLGVRVRCWFGLWEYSFFFSTEIKNSICISHISVAGKYYWIISAHIISVRENYWIISAHIISVRENYWIISVHIVCFIFLWNTASLPVNVKVTVMIFHCFLFNFDVIIRFPIMIHQRLHFIHLIRFFSIFDLLLNFRLNLKMLLLIRSNIG